MFIVRIILAILVFSSGIAVASRFQEWPEATLVTTDNHVYQGKISREILSGDYVIKTSSDRVTVRYDGVSVMKWDAETNPMSWLSTAISFAGLVGMALVLFLPKQSKRRA